MDLKENLIQAVELSRLLREKLLADRWRPGYHFANPEDLGYPGDVNCTFWARGRYHMMYLYNCRSDGFRYGHLSSIDLVHWRSHPDAVMPDKLDGGIFSGGAFVDDDETCYIIYWALPGESGGAGGVRIAKSSDRNYEVWEKFTDYVLEGTEPGYTVLKDKNGEPLYVGCADPSNIWKKGGKYYVQHGALPVLMHFRVSGHPDQSNMPPDPNTPTNIKGDWVDLFESDDLHNWRWLHRFYQRKDDDSWTQANEDDMCPVFIPLPGSERGGENSGKHLQLFISHNRGCQYYTGKYDTENDLFLPEQHGRMSWNDNTFFAPEALKAPDGRVIMWAWLHDNYYSDDSELTEFGWSGVFSLPRSLWLRADGSLGIAPIRELRTLRYNFSDTLDSIDKNSCEIKLSFYIEKASRCGLYLKMSPDGSEYTRVYYDESAQELVFDAEHSGLGPRRIVERAPLKLTPGKKLKLDIFIDNSVVEVFANKRQAICRRIYTTAAGNDRIELLCEGGRLLKLKAWDIMPSNMY